MPNQQTLFSIETQQYDSWMLRELLHNCMAHSNYQLGGRIYVNEFEDYISITNPGSFLPKEIEQVLQSSYSLPYYRNVLLVEAMVRFHIIKTLEIGPATQKELIEVLDRGALSATSDGKQKSKKVSNLLQKMKREGSIYPAGSRNHARWNLSENFSLK